MGPVRISVVVGAIALLWIAGRAVYCDVRQELAAANAQPPYSLAEELPHSSAQR
jgi:hypothetical protein